jgi:hypothetical protein
MHNYRISALGAVVVILGIAGAVIVGLAVSGGGLNSNATPIVVSMLAIVSSTVPSILALVKVESVHNDLKNGLLVDKAQEGAEKAIISQNVVTRDGPTVAATLAALSQVLQSNNVLLAKLIERDDRNGRPGV